MSSFYRPNGFAHQMADRIPPPRYHGLSLILHGRRLVAISSGRATEWLPTFGESWQVVHVPVIDAGLSRERGAEKTTSSGFASE